MGTSYNSNIVTDGLVLCLDAANPRSYPGSGSTWYDLSGSNRNFSIQSNASWNSNGYFSVNAASQSAFIGPPSNEMGMINNNHTIMCFMDIFQGFGSSFFGIAGASGGISLAVPFGGAFYYDVGGCCSATQRLSGSTMGSTLSNLGIFCGTFRCRTNTTPNREFFLNKTSVLNSGANSTASVTWSNSTNCGLCYNWLGYVYQFFMYNRALSDDEIKQNFNTARGRYGIQ